MAWSTKNAPHEKTTSRMLADCRTGAAGAGGFTGTAGSGCLAGATPAGLTTGATGGRGTALSGDFSTGATGGTTPAYGIYGRDTSGSYGEGSGTISDGFSTGGTDD